MTKLSSKQKEILLIIFSLFIFIISLILVGYSLTFFIKNINLILRPNLNQNSIPHFDLERARQIFGSTSTTQ